MVYKNRYIFYLILLLNGCGLYSFKGSTPTGISSICLIPITNNTSDFTLSNLINEKLYDELLNKNVYNVSDIYNSDSSLEIEINSVEDNSNIYSASDDSYEVVKQWKLQVTVKMSWYDIKSSQIILDKKIQEWALYDNSGLDVSIDGIDNDSDGLIDSEDSDEYGTSREAALRIASDKLINRILNELISNW